VIAKAPEEGKHGKRGHDTGGLLRYLFGKGRANEHTNPHLVAAWDPEWLAGGAFAGQLGERGGLAALARQIDAAMTGHDVVLDDGHVYHMVLSVPPADSNAEKGFFGDARWRELVESAIEHMGFGPDAEGVGGCRWVAVHHGLSVNGNDHVHLVVNLVRGDGRVADTYRDYPRWREWCLAVEERYGLTRTSPAGMGRKATSRAELERAKATGKDTDRTRLTQLVSQAAAAADSDEQFLEQLRLAGVRYKPHLSGGKVTGYTVSLTPSENDPEPLWFAGSTLRRDLGLPRLRARFGAVSDDFAEPSERQQLRLWTADPQRATSEPNRHSVWWRQVKGHLQQVEVGLADEVGDDRDRWSQAVGQTADLVVVLADFDADNTHRLRRTADLLSRAAQIDRTQPRPSARQRGVVLPLLVTATRTAAVCKSPTPLMLAAIVVMVYAIITILQRLAEQQHRLHASTHQQITAAGNEMSAHPEVIAEIRSRQEAEWAETPALADVPPVQAPASGSRGAASDHAASSRKPAAKAYVPPSPPATRGRAR
jgi:MobA/VirD2-like, nuclease domain